MDMKFLIKPIAAIYLYYVSRDIGIPHFRTIMTVIGIVLLLTFNILIAFQLPFTTIFPLVRDTENRTQLWINMILVWTPIIILFAFLFSRKRLANQDLGESVVKKAGIVLFVVFTFLISTLIILLVREGLRKGTI